MARPVDSDTETHKYLIEVIRQTCGTKQLVNIIIANNIDIPWFRIPTGSNRGVNDWQTELRRQGIPEHLFAIPQQVEVRTNALQPTHSYSNQAQQASFTLPRLAPRPAQITTDITPPTTASGAPPSTGKKRGRPPKERKEGAAVPSSEQKKSGQDSQARPIKRARQNPPDLNTRPPTTSDTPSLMSATTSTTSPATAPQSSTGPDSASFSAFSGIPQMGLAISSAPSQTIARPAEPHSRIPVQHILTSPVTNTQPARTLPIPRPTEYGPRDTSFHLPGIPSTSVPTSFFGAPPPSAYPQSYTRQPTPSYPQTYPSPLPMPQPPHYRYEGPPPRPNEHRRPDDDTMEQ